MIKIRNILACLTAISIAGCGHSSRAIPAVSEHVETLQPNTLSDIPNKFSAARGKSLKDTDIEAYIDPSVTGKDRKLAHRLLRLMPSNERGDFIYWENEHHYFSNNAELSRRATTVRRLTTVREQLTPEQRASQKIPDAAPRTTHDFVDACSPTHPYPGTGPYVRMMSRCSFAGSIGFLNIPCGTSMMAPGDNGYAYIEVSRGPSDSTEGGLDYYNDGSIAPYLRSTQPGLPNSGILTMNNNGVRYRCGVDLGIASGIAKVDSSNMLFARIGEVPSSFNPRQFWSGAQQITFNNASWLFYQAPPAMMTANGTDQVGVTAPCPSCAVGKVTTIGQVFETGTGSYFGVDANGRNSIHWMQIGYGNWLAGCRDGQLCTLKYARDYTRYYGGPEYYQASGDRYTAQVTGPTLTGYGPWETFDGIALPSQVFARNVRTAQAAFTAPLPPTCTADAQGYCLAYTSDPYNESVWCMDQYGNRDYWYPQYPQSQDYMIQEPNSTMQRFTHTWQGDPYQSCNTTDSWDPAEPSAFYGDSNLP